MKTKTCIQCNRTFTLSTSELEYYRENGLDEPKRCKDCRELNKLREQGNGIVYDPAYGVPPEANERLVYSDEAKPKKKKQTQTQQTATSAQSAATKPKQKKRKSFLWTLGCVVFAFSYIALNSIMARPDALTNAEHETIYTVGSMVCLVGFLISLAGWAFSFYRSKSQEFEPTAAPKTSKKAAKPVYNERKEDIDGQQIIYRFRCADFLDEHFEKHKAEVGARSKTEYLKMANAVIFNKRAKKKRDPGTQDAVFFVPPTGEVVFVSDDGYIRSYYITKKSFQNI